MEGLGHREDSERPESENIKRAREFEEGGFPEEDNESSVGEEYSSTPTLTPGEETVEEQEEKTDAEYERIMQEDVEFTPGNLEESIPRSQFDDQEDLVLSYLEDRLGYDSENIEIKASGDIEVFERDGVIGVTYEFSEMNSDGARTPLADRNPEMIESILEEQTEYTSVHIYEEEAGLKFGFQYSSDNMAGASYETAESIRAIDEMLTPVDEA